MKKIIYVISCVLIAVALTFVYAACDSYDTDAFQKIIETAKLCESNVLIVKEIVEEQHNASYNNVNQSALTSTYDYGSSGVIYKHEDEIYYVLTAYHVVEEIDSNDNIYILLHNQERPTKPPLSLQFQNFARAKVEFKDFYYDLAVLSFQSSEELPCAMLADSNPMYGDKVASISNIIEQRNLISFGKITSKTPVKFGDSTGELQADIIEHSAYVAAGSSGSMLINEKGQLVGINLGGATNIFGGFICGKAMPVDSVKEFVKQYRL